MERKLIEIQTLKKSLDQLDYRQKLLISGVILASLVVLFVDLVSVGSVMPLVQVLTKDNVLAQYSEKLKLSDDMVVLGFASVILLSLVARVLLNLYITWVTKLLCWQMSSLMFENMLSAPYSFFFTSRGEGLQRTILHEADHFVLVVIAFTSLFTNTIAFVAIIAFAVWSFGAEAATLSALAVALIGAIYVLARNLVSQTGKVRFKVAEQRQYAVVSAIRGIREVIHYNVKIPLLQGFDKQNALNARAQFTVAAIKMLPKFSIEITTFFMVVGCLFYLQKTGVKIEDALPQLGLAAFVLYRIAPILQSAFASFATVNYASEVVDNICEVNTLMTDCRTDKAAEKNNLWRLTSKVEFKNVSFKYSENGDPVLKNLNFVLKKGEAVAIIGETGSGKSTLVDIMLGLLEPTEGSVLVDGVPLKTLGLDAWRANVGYVPQDIFIINGSMKDNILFGETFLNAKQDALSDAMHASGIDNLLRKSDISLESEILNDGINLSGGQKQRIAIARGLFKNNGVLVFDEASSALDNHTQGFILSNISAFYTDATKLFVTHNTDVLDFCDKVMILENNVVAYYDTVRAARRDKKLGRYLK